MNNVESRYQIKPWRKDIAGFRQSIEQSGFSCSILEQGILPMEEGRISQFFMEEFGISSWSAKVKGGLVPCLEGDSFLHFLTGLIEWDREADLDYFGIDYGGGEMMEFHYECHHPNGKKMIQLKSFDRVGSDSFAALRLLPPEYNLSSLRSRVLIVCPGIADAGFREEPATPPKIEMRYILVTPSLGDSVWVANVVKENVPQILASENTDCFIFNLFQLADQN